MAVPLDYFDDARFSRTFALPPDPAKGRSSPFTIKYADYGYRNEAHPEDETVLLFYSPMLASRLVHILKDDVAKKHRVRILNPDRPGIGGTDVVEVKLRLDLWTEALKALLVHLGIQHVALGCHSGGTVYALDMLLRHPEILSPHRPYIAIGAPWILPAHTTSTLMSVTKALPAGVIGKAAGLFKFINLRLGPALGVVSGASQVVAAKLKPASHGNDSSSGGGGGEAGDMDREGARFEVEMWPQVLERIYAESIDGLSSEALLLLRKTEDGTPLEWGDWGDYDALIPRIAASLRASGRRLTVQVFFSETDVMIGNEGTKGPLWFDQCWNTNLCSDVVDYRSSVVKGADHDQIWDLKWGAAQQVLEAISWPQEEESLPLPRESS